MSALIPQYKGLIKKIHNSEISRIMASYYKNKVVIKKEVVILQ